MEVEIFDPDEFKFPDYNYKKLLLIEKVREWKKVLRTFFFFFFIESVMRGGDMIERQKRIRRSVNVSRVYTAVIPFFTLARTISL
jgi:hypothetical protein